MGGASLASGAAPETLEWILDPGYSAKFPPRSYRSDRGSITFSGKDRSRPGRILAFQRTARERAAILVISATGTPNTRSLAVAMEKKTDIEASQSQAQERGCGNHWGAEGACCLKAYYNRYHGIGVTPQMGVRG
jgi:hypothetical protein